MFSLVYDSVYRLSHYGQMPLSLSLKEMESDWLECVTATNSFAFSDCFSFCYLSVFWEKVIGCFQSLMSLSILPLGRPN